MKKLLLPGFVVAFAFLTSLFSCQKDSLSTVTDELLTSSRGDSTHPGHHHGLHCDSTALDSIKHHGHNPFDSLHTHHDSLHVHHDSLHVHPHDSLHVHHDSIPGGHPGGGHPGGGHPGGGHGHHGHGG